MTVNPLTPDQLAVHSPAGQFDFESTSELEEAENFIGQLRALAALDFGIGMRRDGYHIFALGETGSGKEAMVRKFLAKKAAGEKTPPDVCYVNNFEEQHRPKILLLAAGTGKKFAESVQNLIEDVRNALRAAFAKTCRSRSSATSSTSPPRAARSARSTASR